MYGTPVLFVEAFGRPETVMLTNLDTPNALTIEPVPLDRALTDAAALVDSYIGRRYQLPLAVTPQILIPYALDIARYRLDRIRNREDVRQRYEDAIRWLEGVRDGKNTLGVDIALIPVESTGSVGSCTFGSDRTSSLDLTGYY